MAKEYSVSFYNSAAWKQCRESYISERRAIDGGMCERCFEKPGLIVHHKIYISPLNINDQSITLNHANLEFICNDCHELEHNRKKLHKTLCGFDSNGRPIKLPD